jgi:hypothetical protein
MIMKVSQFERNIDHFACWITTTEPRGCLLVARLGWSTVSGWAISERAVRGALATLDLVTYDDAQPAFPAGHLEGHAVLSYGELAGLAGGFGRVPRHDSKALALCAGSAGWR